MLEKNIIIVIVPKIDNSSPVKGAVAFCNSLIKEKKVILIDLKGEDRNNLNINRRIRRLSLKEHKNYFLKVKKLNQLLDTFKPNKLVSISYCFQSDLINYLIRNKTYIVSSLRGNIIETYKSRFGIFIGYLFSKFHLSLFKSFDLIISMNSEQKKIISENTKTNSAIIGNFLDETNITLPKKELSSDKFRICFLGRLVPLKSVDQLIIAIKNLSSIFKDIELILIGDGKSKKSLEKLVSYYNIKKNVIFLGYLEDPLEYLYNSNVLVIPSLTEGTSRSALEALYHGIPCIMRDTLGNRELIDDKMRGLLFKNNKELENMIAEIYKKKEYYQSLKDTCLLKNENRQDYCTQIALKKIYE